MDEVYHVHCAIDGTFSLVLKVAIDTRTKLMTCMDHDNRVALMQYRIHVYDLVRCFSRFFV